MPPPVPSVCVVTSGHLASCPRMVKAADAFHEAGYRVRVVATSHIALNAGIDATLLDSRSWPRTILRYGRAEAFGSWLRGVLEQRVSSKSVAALGVERAPLGLVARAFGRMHGALLRAALEEKADLYYGGTAAALAAVALAGRKRGVPYALDLEDFHSEEQDDGPASRLAHQQIDRIEREVMPGAAFLTTGSAAMADAYAQKRGLRPVTINNVFPLPATAPNPAASPGEGLRLYWFSQTVGPGRGLEDAVRAVGLAGGPMELHLRGWPVPGFLDSLRALAAQAAPRLSIIHHDPAPPDPIDLCREGGYDVGLALEQTHVLNRRVCLTNKSFTYMLAGLAVAFTDTPGQHALGADLGEGAFLFPPGDVGAFAAGLRRWGADKALLARAKAAAWEAARRRWHWEHPDERGALLAEVARVIGPASGARPDGIVQ